MTLSQLTRHLTLEVWFDALSCGEYSSCWFLGGNGFVFFFFFCSFLINCWSGVTVVASVVLPQLCNLHCFLFEKLVVLV